MDFLIAGLFVLAAVAAALGVVSAHATGVELARLLGTDEQ